MLLKSFGCGCDSEDDGGDVCLVSTTTKMAAARKVVEIGRRHRRNAGNSLPYPSSRQQPHGLSDLVLHQTTPDEAWCQIRERPDVTTTSAVVFASDQRPKLPRDWEPQRLHWAQWPIPLSSLSSPSSILTRFRQTSPATRRRKNGRRADPTQHIFLWLAIIALTSSSLLPFSKGFDLFSRQRSGRRIKGNAGNACAGYTCRKWPNQCMVSRYNSDVKRECLVRKNPFYLIVIVMLCLRYFWGFFFSCCFFFCYDFISHVYVVYIVVMSFLSFCLIFSLLSISNSHFPPPPQTILVHKRPVRPVIQIPCNTSFAVQILNSAPCSRHISNACGKRTALAKAISTTIPCPSSSLTG